MSFQFVEKHLRSLDFQLVAVADCKGQGMLVWVWVHLVSGALNDALKLLSLF